jgi:phosphate transport system permease protein
MSADALTALPAISARRRRTDKAARAVLLVATLVALIPLVLVLYYLFKRGLGAISWHFFSTDPTGAFIGDPGGIKSALLGTLEIVGLAALISIPMGIGVALYLVEYGKDGRFAGVVRYFVDVMTGVPSIVFGLFVYITLVIGGQFVSTGYAAWRSPY